MFLCFISLLIYYTISQHNCCNNKYEIYNISDNLVSAFPLHSIALRGQPASLHTAPRTPVTTSQPACMQLYRQLFCRCDRAKGGANTRLKERNYTSSEILYFLICFIIKMQGSKENM